MSPNSTRDDDVPDPFGVFRAEWLPDNALFDLFTRPAYFPDLEHPRPSVLVGGRGTGKTTVLRSLSYEGHYALNGGNSQQIDDWPYYGFYYRVNTNRVTAFEGDELDGRAWQRLFAHYINLLLCGQIIRFLIWREDMEAAPLLSSQMTFCEDVAESLCIETAYDLMGLGRAIERGRNRFESFLNSIDPEHLPPLSLQGHPVDVLCNALHILPQFRAKRFFFIIDEYENFLDYQQVVLNTLIKHSGNLYSFKIGVKDLGWRVKHTLNHNERLSSPADYALIDIAKELSGAKFEEFARQVCLLRARRSALPLEDIRRLLPGLTVEEEALKLGVDQATPDLSRQKELEEFGPEIRRMGALEKYFATYWAAAQNLPLKKVLSQVRHEPKTWQTRYNNYKYAILFTIRRKKAGIRKYYCGWLTYVHVSDGNIRYLLELVAQARGLAFQRGLASDAPIDAELQTEAAQRVGRKNLDELAGLSVKGAQLTKLLLGLGLIFETMAEQPAGHKPEVTQFHFPDNADLSDIEDLLTAAIMNLALVRSVATKREILDLRSYDYALHPIFAPFFVFSHRAKRKIMLRPNQISALVNSPREAIRQILAENEREVDPDLPDQLQLFGGYYGGLA